ncbi:MAG: LysM peptidoglycan-binding domain-containing protein [Planctomycetota bacterium]
MTSDAKIGLLLGLAFIFVIGFVINGWPRLCKSDDTNELTSRYIDNLKNETDTLNEQARKAAEKISYESSPAQDSARFQMNLPPKADSRAERIEEPKANVVNSEKDIPQGSVTETASSGYYIVREGDNLASVAVMFYGPLEGSKLAAVNHIFAANKNVLKSPDELYPGQKLAIPPLGSSDKPGEVAMAKASGLLKEAASIGRKHLSEMTVSEQHGQYTVREGDSLWQIAQSQLNDGSRYREIVELNKNMIDDEDTLKVGMILKLPAH